MINGHGDDIHNYANVRMNFSSNIYAGFSHQGLFEHLNKSMHLITSYPEPSPLSLEKLLADLHGLGSREVMVTNGATEAIYLIAQTFRDYEPIIPQPTFSEYADAYPKPSAFCLHPSPSQSSLAAPHIHWLCNPNNPTGHVIPKQELLDRISSHPNDLFVIDASYAAYTDQATPSALDIVSHANALMLCSMTKDYGVPGLRLGYIIANSCLLEQVASYRMPWAVNALAIEAGKYLIAYRAEYQLPLATLLAERQRMETELNSLGITTAHSDSHMLLCKLPNRSVTRSNEIGGGGSAQELKDYLANNHGILIRDASNFPTLTPQHFRIAVQSPEENNQLITAIKQRIRCSK